MKQGIILINAYTQSEAELNQPRRLQEELKKFGVQTAILRNSPSAIRAEGDFCIFLDKDKYAARALEQRMRLFDRAEAIEICDDKMLTHLALGDIPRPEAISSLLCYTPDAGEDEKFLDEVEARLGYPVVVKENHGSLGRQVYLARNRGELRALVARLRPIPHLYEKFISESAGRDVRVICVGERVVACMKRENDHDFRSNLSAGGRGERCEPDAEMHSIAKRVSARLQLDYCGIDLLLSRDGYLVCEVNSNAFFGGIEQVTGINVAKSYAEHIYTEIYQK